MPLHYTKSGALDMRYSSSQAAVASGGGSSSGYGGGASSSGSSGYGRSSYSSTSYVPPPSSSGLNYKKDGSLDMRYASSKEATAVMPSSRSSFPSGELHYKKDGSLDMRYASSKEAVGVSGLSSGMQQMRVSVPCDGLNYKKDGSLDMRYSSSKQAATAKGICVNIPTGIPTKNDGTPDMRRKEAKEWVRQQAFACGGRIPDWVPRKKDGNVNATTAIGRIFAQVTPAQPQQNKREDYWKKRLVDERFNELVRIERGQQMLFPRPAEVIYRPSVQLDTDRSGYVDQSASYVAVASSVGRSASQGSSRSSSIISHIPENTRKIDYSAIISDAGDAANLGAGAFGTVFKATWNGKKVAVKKLHLTELSKKEKQAFDKEICILAHLGQHRNLVSLDGYCTDPPCIVMELVDLGSLYRLLHYCEEPEVEAKMTDGRIKKQLLLGITDGMIQLHVAQIVHGDLKPQNVLVTSEYVAKITDFGLSTLRGKTSSSIRSVQVADDDDIAGVICGTAGYMAPELLDSTSPPDFANDVYSFGIVLNELVSEDEPYADQMANFAGRGPFGATNYARQGKRPTIKKDMTPPAVENLITTCWSSNPKIRLTFQQILVTISDEAFQIPNSVNP